MVDIVPRIIGISTRALFGLDDIGVDNLRISLATAQSNLTHEHVIRTFLDWNE